MTTPAYDIGDTRRLSVQFSDVGGAPAAPTTVTFALREPDGDLTSYATPAAQIVNTGTGAYYVDWTITQAGRHVYRWNGTGAVSAVEQGEFYARRNEAAA